MAAPVDSKVMLIGHECMADSFPKEVSLNHKDPITFETLRDSIEQAQKLCIPCYLLAVTETHYKKESEAKQSFFHVYDGCSLKIHLTVNGRRANDPLTNLPIENVHFFAIQCFEVCGHEVKETTLADDVVASWIKLPADPRVENALFKSLDYLTLKVAVDKDQYMELKERISDVKAIREAQNYFYKRDQSQFLFTQPAFGAEEWKIKKIWRFCFKKIHADVIATLDDDPPLDDEIEVMKTKHYETRSKFD
ncbi:MAG: hypothetical protein WB791_04190 [Waddliaceae bacterium]